MTISAIILAAGRSTRFGAENKLLAVIDEAPMLTQVLGQVRAAGIRDLLVVTGHEAERVARIAAGEGARVVHNPDFAAGLSTSLCAGVAHLAPDADGALILLGDMPFVKPETLLALIEAARATPHSVAAVPVHQGKWGNPVLLRRALFSDVMRLTGDAGARKLLAGRADIVEVAVEDPGIHADFDTQAALASMINR